MIDINDIKVGDKIIVTGIVGELKKKSTGYANLFKTEMKVVTIYGASNVLYASYNGDDYVVGVSTIQEVIKEPEYKIETFEEFGEAKFVSTTDVYSFFNNNRIINLNRELINSVKFILNYEGKQYILLSEFEEFFNNWKYEQLSIGDKVKNKHTDEIGVISNLNRKDNKFDVKIDSVIYTKGHKIQDWDIIS